jgi:taurine dioxygenase/alpha-ketoglutarate-dependent 2,4-dichlorophenoxyacetate dioxygenase
VSQPLVRVHPDRDGRRSLYITANSGREVSGLTLEEGQALHSRLVEHATRPAFTYKHRWRKNDLVVWDNRVLMHRAVDFDRGRYRRDFRRTVVGDKGPVLGPFSNKARNRRPA